MDPEFGRLQLEIEAFVRQKDDEIISLNEAKYRARRSDLTSERVIDEYLESKPERGQVYNASFYNQEIVHIARDYVDLLEGRFAQRE